MSWIPEKRVEYSWLDTILLKLLRCGQIPRHVAFIMDGNRRFARERNIEKIEGHTQGFDKLAETLQWCNDVGVKEVTVYAFSIENFKRKEDEVEGLLNLAREKFRRLIKESDKLKEHGIRVKVIGNVTLLPEDLRDLIAEAEACTRDNSEKTLNVAFSYTAREEIAQAVRKCAEGVEKGLIEPEDIDEDLLERCLYTDVSSTVDLLIRTSGEVRLSDFLLWQSAFSSIYFTQVLWPEFSIRNLLLGVFYFQRQQRSISRAKSAVTSDSLSSEKGLCDGRSREERIRRFIEFLECEKRTN